MTEKLEMYKCGICGNLVQVILEGSGTLVCCAQDMELLAPHGLEDEMLNEKHVPAFIETEDGGEIRIGSIPHPMLPEHYIMFIEAVSAEKDWFKLKYLHPGDEPKMLLKHKFDKTKALAYCNLHGLWTKTAKND
ncbi:MAG: desulfoferrodoxin FeS4 iron-binding domain-containing protein [Heliobacteriaceae bacterium]|jgi:superoxide reductase|nr:desulfoferrodoxin FeS4 iron-binding domain-containing protein [Heliobacteriaceae bacterium]